MSGLKKKITEDMKTFMRAKDKDNLEAVRLLIAQIKRKEKSIIQFSIIKHDKLSAFI